MLQLNVDRRLIYLTTWRLHRFSFCYAPHDIVETITDDQFKPDKCYFIFYDNDVATKKRLHCKRDNENVYKTLNG